MDAKALDIWLYFFMGAWVLGVVGSVVAHIKGKRQAWGRWFFVGGVFVIVVTIVSGYYFDNLSTQAKRSRAFLQSLPAESIEEIRVEPVYYQSLVNQPVVIKDRQVIEQVALLLRNPKEGNLKDNRGFFDNKPWPGLKWNAMLRFVTKEGSYGGEVSTSPNSRTVIGYRSNVTDGWNYGDYRQDQLGPLLEYVVGGARRVG